MLCCLSSLLIDSGWTGGLLDVRWNLNRDMSGLDSERCGAALTGDTSRALLLKCAGQPGVTCQEREWHWTLEKGRQVSEQPFQMWLQSIHTWQSDSSWPDAVSVMLHASEWGSRCC